MATAATAISNNELRARIGTPGGPVIFDVCRREAFTASERLIAGARWRDHMLADQWGRDLDPGREVVVACVHGHNVSQLAAANLRSVGLPARYLSGGTTAFLEAGGASVLRRAYPHDLGERPSRWVTRENPKVDRLACPWFIRRFLDPQAEIIYVEPEWVAEVAEELGGVALDTEGAQFGHDGALCSFDSFLDHFGINDAGLGQMARIIRGADTADLQLAPQCAGLLALLLGLSSLHDDDHAALDQSMVLFDSLYSWIRKAQDEQHSWPMKSAAA